MPSSTDSLLAVIGHVEMWSAIVPISIGILCFKNIPASLKCIILLSLVSLCADILLRSTHGWLIKNIIGRIYTVSEFSLFSLFFYFEHTRRSARILILNFIFLFALIAVGDYELQGPTKLDNVPLGIEVVTLLIYSLIVLYYIMKDVVYSNILEAPSFWIITAILIYLGGSMFIFISTSYMTPEQSQKFWIVHNLLMITYNIFISIGLWKARKQYR